MAALQVAGPAWALVDEHALQSDTPTSPQQPDKEPGQSPHHVESQASEFEGALSAYSALMNGVRDTAASPPTTPPPAPADLKLRSGLQLQTGRQRVVQPGALLSNSHDNARTVGLSDAAARYQVQMFGYRIQPEIRDTGADLHFTPGKVNSGASLQINDIEQWNVQSGYFTSHTGEMRSPVDNAPEIGAWNVSANRRWLDKTLETRVEYARTQATYEADALADDAVDVRMELLSMPWLRLPLFTKWRAGVHYRAIGDQYYSASDIFLPAGLNETSTFLQSSTEAFDVRIGWRDSGQARVDTLGMLPRSQQRAMLSLTYRPVLDDGDLVYDLLGKPSFTTHLHAARQIEPDHGFGSGIGNGRQPLISDIDQQGVALRFEQPLLQWSIQYQQVYQHRFMEPGSTHRGGNGIADLESDAALLSVNLTPADDVSLRMNAQWNQLSEEGSSNLSQQDFYNFGARIELVPSLYMALNYHYAHNQISTINTDADTANQMSSAELSWRALTLKGDQPAVELSVKSSYGTFGDYVSKNFDERWATQLSVNVYWDQLRL